MVLISILSPNRSLGLKKTKGVVSPGQSVCEVTEWRRSAGPGSHPAPAPRSHPGNLKPVGVGSGQRGRSPRVKVRESGAHTQVEPLCRACVCVCVHLSSRCSRRAGLTVVLLSVWTAVQLGGGWPIHWALKRCGSVFIQTAVGLTPRHVVKHQHNGGSIYWS